MNSKCLWSPRLISALPLALAGLAALAADTWLAGQAGGPHPPRPAADAPVRVVKAPARPAIDRLAPCPACTGAARRWL